LRYDGGMRRSTFRSACLLLPPSALLAALAVGGCRSSNEPGPGERPATPAARATALARGDAGPGPAADGTTAAPEPETRAGVGIEAVRAAVRGLVMLQETIGGTAALRALLPQDPASPAPEAATVGTALDDLRALARMEASNATTLGLEDVAPLLDRTAGAAERWAAQLALARGAADEGQSLAARLAELPGRVGPVDDELRTARETGRAALATALPTLAPSERPRAACLAAAADALYAWELARLALAAAARSEDAERARAAATAWRDFLDSGYPLDDSSAPTALPSTADAALRADATARTACRGMTINALPPPGEDVVGLPARGPRRPSP
jgi:hypothetical protein